jgi:1,4-dihydroxy-2-naphthoate polyprenyltransferase
MTPARAWVAAARPKTLSAGVAPVLVGTAAAQRVIAWRFIAALVVALALQVGVNLANDLFDADRGIDTDERLGPRRAVASGLVTRRAMKIAIALSFATAALAGAALAAVAGYGLLVVGAASCVAALGYSGGPRPYGAAGLGEVFVFVFFGLVATIGSAYVQIERVDIVAVAASLPTGSLATAILVANNVRDRDGDARAGKVTLAVRLGDVRARRLYRALLYGAFSSVVLVALVARSAWPLIAVLAAPAARPGLRLIEERDPRALIGALAATARLELVLGALLAGGLWATR